MTAAVWAIGDVQGCDASLAALLERPEVADDVDATFWFAGDLVNRGPASLATLRRIIALGDRAQVVLGNHDLHLLGVAAGARKPGRGDTVREILDAPDAAELLDWLRTRPLAHLEHGWLMVHAGVLPSWTAARTRVLAAEVEAVLRGGDWQAFLREMYGNAPRAWHDALAGTERLRVIVNALTRMRLCSAEGVMDFEVKEGAADAPAGLMPWFDVPGRATADASIVFGHWSTMGLVRRPGLRGLDTGCVWGGQLTAVRLHDDRMVQVACPQCRVPDAH